MFESIYKVLNNAKKITDSKAWKHSIDNQTKQFIISLNTHEQLGDEGVDSDGKSLGDYAPFTVNFRRSKGLQVDHIDFKVTGKYWASWRVIVKSDYFIIETDRDRFDELVNLLRFSPDHVGLTDENLQRLGEWLKNKYIDYVKEQLLY